MLSKAQKEAVGCTVAETELVEALENEGEDNDGRQRMMEDRECSYEIERRGSRNGNGRKWFSSCPRWRVKSRANNQVTYIIFNTFLEFWGSYNRFGIIVT